MDRYRQRDLEIPGPAAALMPPAMVEETGWDILLALHSDRRGELTLDKLGAIASVRPMAMAYWLSWLEDRRLVAAVTNEITGVLRAILTADGRDLLDRYFSAIGELQAGTRD